MTDRDRLPEDLISGYLDGELTVEQRTAVEQQLARSTVWAAVLVELTDVRARVRALPVPEAPIGFWDAVLEGRDPVSRARRRLGGPLGWVAGGAAAAVVAVAFIVPSPHHASPSVATLVDSHAARSSLSQDPITQLAPIGFPR
jgi:anti-sigma factor RsiW